MLLLTVWDLCRGAIREIPGGDAEVFGAICKEIRNILLCRQRGYCCCCKGGWSFFFFLFWILSGFEILQSLESSSFLQICLWVDIKHDQKISRHSTGSFSLSHPCSHGSYKVPLDVSWKIDPQVSVHGRREEYSSLSKKFVILWRDFSTIHRYELVRQDLRPFGHSWFSCPFLCSTSKSMYAGVQGLAEHKDTLGAPLCPCRWVFSFIHYANSDNHFYFQCGILHHHEWIGLEKHTL